MSETQKAPEPEYVLVEKRVLKNAINIIGNHGTGEVPFKVVAEVVGELQEAHEGGVVNRNGKSAQPDIRELAKELADKQANDGTNLD